MLKEYLLYTFISFFAVYGFIQIVIYTYDFFLDCKRLKNKVIYTVVALKDEEENAEMIARAMLLKTFKNDSGIADNKLIMVDMESEDNTKAILKRMEMEGKGLIVMDKEELIKEIEKNL